MKPVVNRNAPKGASSSSSTPPSHRYNCQGGKPVTSRPIEMTRANLDQWKRTVRQQMQQKVQKLNSLRTEVENLLKGMQEKIETVSDKFTGLSRAARTAGIVFKAGIQ